MLKNSILENFEKILIGPNFFIFPLFKHKKSKMAILLKFLVFVSLVSAAYVMPNSSTAVSSQAILGGKFDIF